MIKSVFDAISIALNAEFGDGYTIYTENVRQGFREPCFFIQPITEVRTAELCDTVKKRLKVDILFFPPENSSKKSEIIRVLDIMLEKMSVLFVDGNKIRGNEISSEIEDDVLHFIVNYDFRLIKNDNTDFMEKLNQKGGLKK